ncbi:MAG TPA: diaminopimelate decarboxylase [Chitinophagaceae bacterium]|nr:diaminopimelate decarboxylase [Chitinophagaceae bacterium]MCC6635291.1 diaminopimelate decarboxylase [Chitinophagaceae bacterium]HMZ46062.1 diaminopimelate decarboxylase [Chitinophagaceae bacterium]HNE93148.1 diaminopimelate decarboxylase [Chitinophagaceae bacterium]HNF29653.1 diaminopimelate decarboxylase [Chitinophagaceae bacterium]
MQQPTNEQFLEIAQQFGTPVYVYDANKIVSQYQKFKSAFNSPTVKIFYACKALTNINILKLLKLQGANIDCSSINEVKLAIHAGFEPQQILYTSNGIGFDEIEEAKNLGIHINIDSISNLKKFGQKFNNSYPVGVRLRPNIMAGGNIKIATGHDKSKFGIPITQIAEVVDIMQQYNLLINGVHIHTGSDIKEADVFLKGIEVLFDVIHLFPNLMYVDLGGGFKVPFEDTEEETDMITLANKILEKFNQHLHQNKLQIWFEPGKYLVSQAGYFLTKINVLKKTNNIEFASINSGFNHLLRPMFYDAYHKIVNISNPNGTIKEYDIVGNICETDTFAANRNINEINEGDLLVFYNAGAYGFEMSSNYNSRYKPAEVLIHNNQISLIRKADRFEDLLKNQIVVL